MGGLSPALLVVWSDVTSRTCPWDRNLTCRTRAVGIHRLLVSPLVSVPPSMPMLSHCPPRMADPSALPHRDTRASELLCGAWPLQEWGGYSSWVEQGHGMTPCLFQMSKLAVVINSSENRLFEKQMRAMETGSCICCHTLSALVGHAVFRIWRSGYPRPRPGWTGLGAAWSSERCPCPWLGGWNEMVYKVPAKPKQSVTL